MKENIQRRADEMNLWLTLAQQQTNFNEQILNFALITFMFLTCINPQITEKKPKSL